MRPMTWRWNVDEEYLVLIGYIAKIKICGEWKLENGWQRSVCMRNTADLRKDIRFILEWHLRYYILSEGKLTINNTYLVAPSLQLSDRCVSTKSSISQLAIWRFQFLFSGTEIKGSLPRNGHTYVPGTRYAI